MKHIAKMSCLLLAMLSASPAFSSQPNPAASGAHASIVSTATTVTTAIAASADEQALMERMQRFYSWALKNGKQVSALQPVIRDIPKSKKFGLDTRHLKAFTDQYLASGNFAPEFSIVLENYYGKYKKDFAAYSDAEFAQIARDGRGPLMETEDMDIFFCAQEYEYTKAFIAQMKPKAIRIDGDKASMTVVSAYQWETGFHFVKSGQQWLISAYCVYK